MNSPLKCIKEMKIVASKRVGGSIPSQEPGSISEEANVIASLPELEVIAPVDIVRRILKAPYSKARVSIAIYRFGQTLVLNPGPDFEEGKKLTSMDPEPTRRSSGVLMFSTKSYAVTSLGFRRWDAIKQVTWLQAWFQNVMSSVHELLLCNMKNGCVVGYRLLTDRISPAVVDHLVAQQSVVDVLSFLQSTCEEDPGVYWLYKSYGEDIFQLYDLSTISKNHSSSPSISPHVVLQGLRACAHEQLARLVLSGEEFDLTTESDNVQRTIKIADLEEELRGPAPADRKSSVVNSSASGTSLDIGPACQDPQSPLQTTTSQISSQLAAVQHVYEAIRNLLLMLKLESSEQEGKLLPTSKPDGKLWSLVLLLGESYLSLGVAYKENGQLYHALKAVELACYTYGSVPKTFDGKSFVSAIHKSFSLLFQKLDEASGSCDKSFKDIPPGCLFWAKVWLVVGEILLSQKGSEVAKKEEELLQALEMPSDIEEKVESLKKSFKGKICEVCSLKSCRCDKNKKNDKSNIFKYLNWSGKVDEESYFSSALDCYEEVKRTIQMLPRKELKPLIRKIAWLWNEVSLSFAKTENFNKAEEALAKAIEACKECGDHTNIIIVNYNFGGLRRDRAVQLVKKIPSLTSAQAQKNAQEAAKQEYIASLKYHKEAKKELSVAIEQGSSVPEDVRYEVCKRLGDAHLQLYKFMSVQTASATPRQLKVISRTTHDAFREAFASYKSLGEKEVAYAYIELAKHHNSFCLRFFGAGDIDKAREHALLSDEQWHKSLDYFGPENEPSQFLTILLQRSVLYFSLPQQSNSVLETLLSLFLECHRISETDEAALWEKLSDFWPQLQKILRQMVSSSAGAKEKLRELYLKSLRAENLSELDEMSALWKSTKELLPHFG